MNIKDKPEKERQLIASSSDAYERCRLLLDYIDEQYLLENVQASNYIEEVFEIAKDLDHFEFKTWGNYYRAAYFYLNSQMDNAHKYLQIATKDFNELKHADGMAKCCCLSGSITRHEGNFERALQYFHEGYHLLKKNENKKSVAVNLYEQGYTHLYLRDFLKAFKKLSQSLTFGNEIGNRIIQTHALNGLGNLYRKTEQWEKALNYYDQKQKIDRSLNNQTGLAQSYINQCKVLLNPYFNQTDHAIEMLSNAIEISRQFILPPEKLIKLHLTAGHAYLSSGEYEKAFSHFSNALSASKEPDSIKSLADAHFNTGNYYYKIKDYDTAMEHFAEAEKNYLDFSPYNFSALTRTQVNMGKCLTHKNEFVEAEGQLLKAIKTAQKHFLNKEYLYALKAMYKLKKAEGKFEEALHYHEQFLTNENEFDNKNELHKIRQLEKSYQLEEKEKELKFARKKNEALEVGYDLLEKEKEQKELVLKKFLPFSTYVKILEKANNDECVIEEKSIVTIKNPDKFNLVDKTLNNLLSKTTDFHFYTIKINKDAIYLIVSSKQNGIHHLLPAIELVSQLQQKHRQTEIFIHTGKMVNEITGISQGQNVLNSSLIKTAEFLQKYAKPGKTYISDSTCNYLRKFFYCKFSNKIKVSDNQTIRTYIVEKKKANKDDTGKN